MYVCVWYVHVGVVCVCVCVCVCVRAHSTIEAIHKRQNRICACNEYLHVYVSSGLVKNFFIQALCAQDHMILYSLRYM